jgi:predicted HTH domain antitoxin
MLSDAEAAEVLGVSVGDLNSTAIRDATVIAAYKEDSKVSVQDAANSAGISPETARCILHRYNVPLRPAAARRNNALYTKWLP